jgi:hypothetical protein
MILDILTVLFFVLGFALLFWMIGERRRDVLYYVTKSRDRMVARKRPSDRRSSTSNAADELSRASSATSMDTSAQPKAKGK